MGGDEAPSTIVEGAIRASNNGCNVVLVGDRTRIEQLIPPGVDIPIVHATQVVDSSESPLAGIKSKRDSSISVAVALVAKGLACAVVSFGNTGAAMATSLLGLGRIKGVQRPALAASLPTVGGGRVLVLDLGANVECSPSQLYQFGIMGHVYAKSYLNLSDPRVGLVSNGEEQNKGTPTIREAASMLSQSNINFIGQIEPHVAFTGGVDVLVCDGFVGNVVLKTVELSWEMAKHSGPASITAGIDYRRAGGAMFLGVKGPSFVGHGRSDAATVETVVTQAFNICSNGSISRLEGDICSALSV